MKVIIHYNKYSYIHYVCTLHYVFFTVYNRKSCTVPLKYQVLCSNMGMAISLQIQI